MLGAVRADRSITCRCSTRRHVPEEMRYCPYTDKRSLSARDDLNSPANERALSSLSVSACAKMALALYVHGSGRHTSIPPAPSDCDDALPLVSRKVNWADASSRGGGSGGAAGACANADRGDETVSNNRIAANGIEDVTHRVIARR